VDAIVLPLPFFCFLLPVAIFVIVDPKDYGKIGGLNVDGYSVEKVVVVKGGGWLRCQPIRG
jgi:hypothetical protein